MTDGSAQADAKGSGPDPLIGRVINERFRIISVIARGGMGKVYKTEQAPLGRTCALKVLNPKYAGDSDPEFHKRFFLEASIASKLTHPNTVTIFDYGRTDDDIYYMAMEFLEGRTLHKILRVEGALGEQRTAHIARQICRSLREAHSVGVVHRDLKPANIFLVDHSDERDFVKVLDFGLVKTVGENRGEDLTKAGLFMGSPKYMAPEQIRGDEVDSRTDVYSLGIIMYEMLCGKVPFDRPNSVHIMMAHVNEAPPALQTTNPKIQVSPSMQGLVLKCLEKDPNDRFASMEEVLNQLKDFGANQLSTVSVSGVLSPSDLMASTGASGVHVQSPAAAPPEPSQITPAPALNLYFPPSEDEEDKLRSRIIIALVVALVLLILVGTIFVLTRDASTLAGCAFPPLP